MKLRILTIFIVLLYFTCSYSQGLSIKGNRSLIDERSSYDVFNKVSPTFKNVLIIDFSIILEITQSRGNIMRIKTDELGAIYNISYYGDGNASVFKLNHEGKDALLSITVDRDILDKKQWLKMHIEFDMQNDVVRFRINEKEASEQLLQEKNTLTPLIHFGRSEHIIDIPPFRMCELTVRDNDKKYYFPLNESEGEFVHDSNKKIIGHVTNPAWLINNAYYWAEGPSFSSKKVAGSNFNSDTQDVYYFNEDSITIFNIRTGQTNYHKYANGCPISMRLGMNFLDIKNKKLYAYEVADPPVGDVMIAALDMNTLTWDAVTTEALPMQLHHHSNYMDNDAMRYTIFGGFGSASYSKNFYSFDIKDNKWDKMEFSGDAITPRYFSSMGCDKENQILYVFGGMGNESGDQTIGRVYYYELYGIDLNTNKITKRWQIPWSKENVVPVRNMVITDSEDFYTLCYPEHFSHSFLKLYHFSIKDGEYTVLGDSIPILSEKITTNANLYYDKNTSQLIAIVQEFDYDDIASKAKIYMLSFPPVTKADLMIYTSVEATDWKWFLSVGIIFILITVFITFIFIKRRKNNSDVHTDLDIQPLAGNNISDENRTGKSQPNAVYLFGDFSMIDRNGREINYMLSSKLRHAFFLILYYSLKAGITSQEFSEILWPNKSYNKVKNSRGVALNNLRKILGELDGISLMHEKGVYKIVISDGCYCDYLRCIEMTNNNAEENMEEFVSIISRGKFLNSEDVPLLDPFKNHIERQIESSIYFYIEKAYNAREYMVTISLCESLFNLDPLDEEAIRYMIKALLKLDQKDEAKRRYYLFVVDYKKTMGEDYAKSFGDLVK